MNLRPPGPQPGALPDCATPRGPLRFYGSARPPEAWIAGWDDVTSGRIARAANGLHDRCAGPVYLASQGKSNRARYSPKLSRAWCARMQAASSGTGRGTTPRRGAVDELLAHQVVSQTRRLCPRRISPTAEPRPPERRRYGRATEPRHSQRSSGRRELNPYSELGRLLCSHNTSPARCAPMVPAVFGSGVL